MYDFVETLDPIQLSMLDYAITFHMGRHIERGRSEEQARNMWADLLEYMVRDHEELIQGIQAHG
jgi:hypothetical protein